MRSSSAIAALFCVALGCQSSHERVSGDAISIGADGLSDPIAVEIPAGARSLTIVVDGAPRALYALASLILADGTEVISGVTARDVEAAYPGVLGPAAARQLPRRGQFAFQYPMLAEQRLAPGRATLRIASSARSSRAGLEVIVGTGAPTELHVALVSFAAEDESISPAAIAHTQAILRAAGITLVVDEAFHVRDAGVMTLAPIAETTDAVAPLVAEAHALARTDALPILLVELGVGHGVARGLPVPATRSGSYFAVLVDPTITWPGDRDLALARVIAHELAHALGLPHVDDRTPDGVALVDPFDDTSDFDDTLMGSADIGQPISARSIRISPRQAFAMTRSALLE